MNQKLLTLIKSLDESFLKMLPCSWPSPDTKEFLIGIGEGPRIQFNQETEDSYVLVIDDGEGNSDHIPLPRASQVAVDCEGIHDRIRLVTANPHYQEDLKEKLGLMISNFKRHIYNYFGK